MITMYYCSDPGTRASNEDCFGFNKGRVRSLKKKTYSGIIKSYTDDNPFAVISDGMGGEDSGEIFSKSVVRSYRKYISNPADERTKLMCRHISKISRRCRGGATLVASEFRTDGRSLIAYITAVGDSPCYLIREGHVKKITRDDNLYQKLCESGEIPEDEYECRKAKANLMKFFGMNSELTAQEYRVITEPGDIFVLCSDGCELSSEDSLDFLSEKHPAKAFVNANTAKNIEKYKASDNATAVIIEV